VPVAKAAISAFFRAKAHRFGGNGTRNDVPWAAEHALEVRAGIPA